MPTTRSQTKLSNIKRMLDVDRTPSQAFAGPMIEWLDLDFSETSPIKQMNWKDSLNEMIQGAEGCSHITFACPLEMPHRLWIIIQWLSATQRNEFHRTDTIASNATKTLYQYSDHFYFSYRLEYSIGKVISVGFPFDPDPRQVHEVWMVYFPIYSLDAKKQEHGLPLLTNFWEEYDESNPMTGIICQDIAWLSGEINYQGVQCQRLAWLMKWKSKEAEELYKTTVRWVTGNGGKSSKPQLTLSIFIDELTSLGMVGYETWHAHFEDIRDVLGIRAFRHPALYGMGVQG